MWCKYSNTTNQISKTYQAGNLGGVKWGYNSILSSQTLFRYGLPSSNILDSVPELVETLLPEDEDRQTMSFAFILGYLCANGTISWCWTGQPSNCRDRYEGIRLFARDRHIIEWFQKEAEIYDCRSAIGLKRNAWRNVNAFYFAVNNINNNALLNGLRMLQGNEVAVDGKLLLLLQFLGMKNLFKMQCFHRKE